MARPATLTSDVPLYERVTVWELPVRVTHWVNAAAIFVLAGTGYYIGDPFVGGSEYLMSWIRAIHRLTAWVLIASLSLRVYWAFAGNRWASWRAMFPYLTRQGWRDMRDTFLFYTFLRRQPPGELGHNALAGIAYSGIVFLLLVEIVTGFAMLSLERGAGWTTWFQWVFWFGSPQNVRLLHHLIMWLLLGFVVHHVYSSILMDFEEGNGLISSIFSGTKTRRIDR